MKERADDFMGASELKQARADLGLSQAALAAKLGVSLSAVTHWEQGRRPISGPVVRLIRAYQAQEECK